VQIIVGSARHWLVDYRQSTSPFVEYMQFQRSFMMPGLKVSTVRLMAAISLECAGIFSYASGIEVPEGHVLKHSLSAEGVQIYECMASTDGNFTWTFNAPEARLFGGNGAVAVMHYAGPTWEAVGDKSKIVGQRVASSPSASKNSIPQLLLSAKVLVNGEMFEDIVYIQRIDTTGGSAPESGCDASSSQMKVSVPYTARYNFFKKG
jgi:hypothetical protein